MRFFRGRLEKAEINIVRRHQRRSKIRETINKHVIAACSFDLRVYSSFVLASEGSMFAYVHRSNWMSCYFLTRSISLSSALVTLDKIKQILLRFNVNLKENFLLNFLQNDERLLISGRYLEAHLSWFPGFSSHFFSNIFPISMCNNNYQCKPREFLALCFFCWVFIARIRKVFLFLYTWKCGSEKKNATSENYK